MDSDRSDKLEQKLDHIVEKISNIDVTLAKQATSLEDHIRRTNILEKKLEPIDKHVTMIKGVVKFLGMLLLTTSLIEAILNVMSK